MCNSDMAYHLGVYMGDGFLERYYRPNSRCTYIGLKSIDLDFVQHWVNVMERLTGKRYAIHTEKAQTVKHNVRYRARAANKELVEMTLLMTGEKTKVPDEILHGEPEVKKAFLQGLMDSEAWISAILKPLGMSYISLSFGVTDHWCKEVEMLFNELGIETSKMQHKKSYIHPISKTPRKEFFAFNIHVLQYVDAGMGFTMKRKQDRLNYCTTILRDHTRNYPSYADYLPKGKAAQRRLDDMAHPNGNVTDQVH
jgi:hypothetical protein